MPIIVLNTNISTDAIPEKFIFELSSLMSMILGKPEKYITIHVNHSQMMTFGGTTHPCAQVFVACVGKLGEEENKGHTAALTDKIHNDLKIDKDRMMIVFRDVAGSDTGWDGHTFAKKK